MIGEFCEKIAVICFFYNASVTSWIRSERRNNQVGGHPQSRHRLGLAVDVVLDGHEAISAKQAFIDECERYGLKAINEGDHIHVQSN